MKEINLSKANKTTMVDDDIFEIAKDFQWGVFKKGKYLYAVSYPKNKRIFLHHLVAGKPKKGFVVDHINHNTLDNRRENLRVVTLLQNRLNSKKSDKKLYPYKGIGFRKSLAHKNKPWFAVITVDKKKIVRGNFRTPEEAARKYDELARMYFGEFAFQNFNS